MCFCHHGAPLSAGASKHSSSVASTAQNQLYAALHTRSRLTSHLLLKTNSTYLNSLVEQNGEEEKTPSALHVTETDVHGCTHTHTHKP